MVNIKETDINIYIIDDDELLTKILRTKFEQTGDYKIITFSTGEEFLEYITGKQTNRRQIHIVILDYLLKTVTNEQAKNGIDILKAIKELNSEIEVIMLSGVNDPDLSAISLKHGAITFVKKNENAFLRINNNVKFIISQKRLEKTKKSSMITRHVFLTLTVIVLIIIAYYLLSELYYKN